MKRFVTILALSTALFPLRAHDLYLMPARFQVKPGDRLTIAIHNGDSFPESENAPVISRLRDVKLGGRPVGKLRKLANKAIGEVVVRSAGTLILTTRTIPNFIELDAARFAAYLNEEGLEDVLRSRRENGESAKPHLCHLAPEGRTALQL